MNKRVQTILKKRFVITMLLVVTVRFFSAYGSETDSLALLLPELPASEKVTALNKLAFLFRVKEPDQTILYAKEALQLARQINDRDEEQMALSNIGLGYRYSGDYTNALSFQQEALRLALDLEKAELIAREYNRLGIIYKQLGFYNDALLYYLRALSIREKTGAKPGIADLYNNIGNVYRNRGELGLALDYYLKSKDIREALGDKEGYSYSLHNIGIVYLKLRNYQLAIEALNESLRIKTQMDDKYGVSTTLSSLGEVFSQMKEIEKAMEYYEQSLHIQETMGFTSGIAENYASMGKACIEAERYESASEYLEKAMKIYEETGERVGVIRTNIRLSQIFIEQKDYTTALDYLNKSLGFARKENMLLLIQDIYYQYSTIYSLTGEFEKALDFHIHYAAIKDSVFNEEIGQKITELQLKAITDQHEKESKILSEKNKAEIKRKNQFIYFLVAITFLVLVLVILIMNRSMLSRRANKELEKKNKSISEQNHFLQVVMDTIPNPMYYKDIHGKFLGCNLSFEKLHGKKKEQIVGKTSIDIYPESLASFYSKKDRELFNNPGMQQFESRITLPDRDVWEVIFYKNTFNNADGSVAGLVGIILDITGRKKAEIKLKRSEKELLEANATKDKFFSILAHDLSNPFNAILGFSRLLLADYRNFDEEEVQTMIENIFKATDSASRLLQNLLEWSRAQTGRLELHPELTDLSLLINENIKFFTSMARSKEIRVLSTVAFNTIAYADKNMVNTVIRNLLQNALKFTNFGGKVDISATKSNGLVEISIADTGIGIEKEDLPKLFRIDEQVRQKGTANENGTGLGLILCKEFIEKNGGEISIESEAGTGSVFRFTLPVK